MSETQTISINLTVPFTDEDIDLHIFSSGFTSYPWWSESYFTIGGIRYSDGYGDGYKDKEVSFDDIRKSMETIISTEVEYTALARQQLISGIANGDFDIDADGADQIMQHATLGEVVYG